MGKWLFTIARKTLDEILEIIYEPSDTCPTCFELFMQKEYLCPNCINKIKYCTESSFEIHGKMLHVYSLSYFSGVTQKLIINLKYKSDFDAGRFLARLLYEKYKDLFKEIDLLIPAPCSYKSFSRRGYNQSFVICKEIQKISNIKTLDILTKSNKSRDQIGLSKEERWQNLKDSINIKEKNLQLKLKKVILIDDVFTTGATSYYCVEALKKTGIKDITILTLAKGSI